MVLVVNFLAPGTEVSVWVSLDDQVSVIWEPWPPVKFVLQDQK